MRDFIRVLQNWMQRIVSETEDEAAAVSFRTITSNTSLAKSDRYVLADSTNNNVTVTLPDAATVIGCDFIVKRLNTGGYSLTIATVSGTIDGAVTWNIPAQYMSFTFKSDGADYWIV
jgi:hypothetical protein